LQFPEQFGRVVVTNAMTIAAGLMRQGAG
jgi:hypothetical protein